MSVFTLIAILLSAALAVEGSIPYDDKKEFCCEGKVFKRENYESSGLLVCCAQEVKEYTVLECKDATIKKQECCGGQLVNIPTDPNLECCGGTYYNQIDNICFNDQVVPIAPKNNVVGRRSICGDNSSNVETFYNAGLESCCGAEVLYNKVFACCNGEPFNTSSHICCSDFENMEDPDENRLVYSIIEIPNSAILEAEYGCCKGQFMDMKTQVCCKDGPLDTKGEKVNYCCGYDQFVTNETAELCLKDTIVDRQPGQKVCKDEVYDTATQYCYKGNVIELEGKDYCESAEDRYSISEQLCCPDGVIDKTDKTQNSCCKDDSKFDYYPPGSIPPTCYI